MSSNLARDRQIARAYHDGEALQSIADSWGLSRERVRQIAMAQGEKPRAVRQDQERPMRLAAAQAEAEWMEQHPEEVKLPISVAGLARKHGLPVSMLKRYYGPEWITRMRRAVHESRSRGEGWTSCVYCKERLPWSEMRAARTNDGTPTRSRVCRECNSRQARAASERRPPTEAPTVARKPCSRCGAVKPAKGFYRSRGLATGLQSWCKECQRGQTRERW